MGRLVFVELAGVLVGAALLAANVGATRRIWISVELERSQKIAQTILVWLLPGAFLAIRYELDPPREPKDDPTVQKVTDDSSHVLGANR
jgi:hypothetical protein